MSDYTVVGHSDVLLYLPHLESWLKKSKAVHLKHATMIEVELGFRQAVQDGRVVRVKDFVAVFNITKPWYSSKPVLCEELIARVGPDGTLADVVVALEGIASAHGAVGVHLGDEQGFGAGQEYSRLGYNWLGSSFYSEVPWVS